MLSAAAIYPSNYNISWSIQIHYFENNDIMFTISILIINSKTKMSNIKNIRSVLVAIIYCSHFNI